MSLPGIGAKVADCICLMSLDFTDSVPIDTHVLQLTAKLYADENPSFKMTKSSLTPKKYLEIGNFYRQKFRLHAGWAQTVLFCSDLRQISQDKVKNKNPD
ncbi:N-glycosylase/DNA lyase-like protein [Euroglyphus maynei]|uniref:N-glycosylase/DNA lyase-like protein n=1 Tax=Euroglyphus maynei TaxID=6958 RepID=A0A1Y3BF62_EURMA|nr:N-glycosylase/DNA lyase-like protein [Euroglyphus maynei]